MKDFGAGNPINYNVSDEQYNYNVMIYLTYMMPKNEFKTRFLKNNWFNCIKEDLLTLVGASL
ncbi:hypothetical protein [Mucilaginibacter sp.]|uniref:hypothetical protein n=1 Tax=Mucilaginibacter sp. TaxID=1882438 RepID=UPI000969AB00|nr:hypothetical protein [Mucilaginibacter sp.]OJW12815.1 MAG: hypothetical protein BGO48_02730 [Mucilaginibacter sp. 44-25]PLW89594.1 MAG: hypothetical protein C0154_10790 [Mucilaginibacter sp.]